MHFNKMRVCCVCSCSSTTGGSLTTRWDVRLPLEEPPVRAAVNELLRGAVVGLYSC